METWIKATARCTEDPPMQPKSHIQTAWSTVGQHRQESCLCAARSPEWNRRTGRQSEIFLWVWIPFSLRILFSCWASCYTIYAIIEGMRSAVLIIVNVEKQPASPSGKDCMTVHWCPRAMGCYSAVRKCELPM